MVRFYNNGVEVGLTSEDLAPISFPITEVGSQSTVSITIKNDSEEHIELIPYVNDRDVHIQEYPKKLGPQESATATWLFTPQAERLQEEKRSLHTIGGFKEIIA